MPSSFLESTTRHFLVLNKLLIFVKLCLISSGVRVNKHLRFSSAQNQKYIFYLLHVALFINLYRFGLNGEVLVISAVGSSAFSQIAETRVTQDNSQTPP